MIFTSIVFPQDNIIKLGTGLNKAIQFKDISVLQSNEQSPERILLKGSEWKIIDLTTDDNRNISNMPGTTWLYKQIIVSDTLGYEKEISLNLWNVGEANEIYWNNKLIGVRHRPSPECEEDAKLFLQQVKIPFDHLTIGTHNLFIKVINSSENIKENFTSFEIGYDRYFIKRQVQNNYIIIIFSVVLFILSLYFIIMFFGFNSRISYLFFALFCFFNAMKAYYSPLWIIHNTGLSLAAYNDLACSSFYTFGNLSLLAFFIFKFELYKKSKSITGLILLSPLLIIPFGESISQVIFFAICYLIVFYAVIKKEPSSIFSLTALTLFAVWSLVRFFTYFWYGYFVGVICFAIVMLFEVSKRITSQIKLRREADLRSARLENELLKRNIQPHFILNTLTALQEVVEQEPQQAVKLIQALADEFRLFSKVSGEKLISINDELELCKAHLKIMEYRKGATFSLVTENIKGDELIPPGIFHTIIENGTTHGFGSMINGEFRINKIIKNGCSVFEIFNNGNNNNDANDKGTGIKYIKTRLEESFPGKWELNSKPVSEGWLVEIIICKN